MEADIRNERNRLLATTGRLLEGPMVFLGFVWLILITTELIWGLPKVLEIVSLIIWALFILDFLLKFLVAPAKIRFMRKNWLTAVSLLIPAFRIFRLVRIFRLLPGVRVVKVISSLNRSMKSLAATMSRRGFAYVVLLSVIVIFVGAAGMYAIEKGNRGFSNYGLSLWWTSMRVITAGSDYWPISAEGRLLAFVLSLFGYAVFGYVTATLATFFIGRDAEEKDAPVAGAKDIKELRNLLAALSEKMDQLNDKITAGRNEVSNK